MTYRQLLSKLDTTLRKQNTVRPTDPLTYDWEQWLGEFHAIGSTDAKLLGIIHHLLELAKELEEELEKVKEELAFAKKELTEVEKELEEAEEQLAEIERADIN